MGSEDAMSDTHTIVEDGLVKVSLFTQQGFDF